MSEYPLPDDVDSPRQHWTLIRVLFRGDQNEPESHDPYSYSVAVGMWDGKPCLAVRWNANEGLKAGSPQSRGLPTWFIIPKGLQDGVLATLTKDAQDFAKGILGKK